MRIWGRSSSGRASGSQSESGEFESRRLQKICFHRCLSIDNSSRYDAALLVTIAGFGDGKGLFLTLESTTLSLFFVLYTTFSLSFLVLHEQKHLMIPLLLVS